MSIDVLIDKIREKKNPSVVGLDPKLEYVPKFIKDKYFREYNNIVEAAAKSILCFNKMLIDELHDIIPAVKPQSAYYEMYGYEGVKVLYETIKYAKEKGLYVITDVKRNDIGSTAKAYSSAYLGKTEINGTSESIFDTDSITVNPYLGTDGIEPFIEDCQRYNKSIFILVKTSNKSSGELQDLICQNEYVYEKVALLVKKWGDSFRGVSGYSNIGAVVGATYPEIAKKLRKIMPHTYFLVPGYGAQGAGAEDVEVCFNPDGLGAIVNSSRKIMCAYINNNIDEHDFAKAARDEAIKMRDEISDIISN